MLNTLLFSSQTTSDQRFIIENTLNFEVPFLRSSGKMSKSLHLKLPHYLIERQFKNLTNIKIVTAYSNMDYDPFSSYGMPGLRGCSWEKNGVYETNHVFIAILTNYTPSVKNEEESKWASFALWYEIEKLKEEVKDIFRKRRIFLPHLTQYY